MHNGTIKGKFDNSDAFETDSEALIYNIDKKGVEPALLEANEADGAFAVVYFDSNSRTLNICRNYKRPLYYFKRPEKDVLFWSSDRDHLDSVVKSMGWGGVIVAFSVNTLYTMPCDPFPKKFEFTEKVLKLTETVSYNSHYPSFSSKGWQKKEEAFEIPEYFSRPSLEKQGNQVYSDFYNSYDSVSERYFTEFQLKKLIEYDKRHPSPDKNDNAPVPLHGPSTVSELKSPLKEDIADESLFAKVFQVKEAAKVGNTIRFPTVSGKAVSYLKYKELIKPGCCCCSASTEIPKTVRVDENNHVPKTEIPVVWINNEDHLCYLCAKDAAENQVGYLQMSYGLSSTTLSAIARDVEDIETAEAQKSFERVKVEALPVN